MTKDVTAAASALGIEIGVVEANNGRAIEAAFATLVRSRSEALLIGTDPFFFSRRVQRLRWRRAMSFLPPLIHVSSWKSAAS